MSKRSYRFLLSFVIVTLSILSVVGIYQFKRAENLALEVENQYVHAFHEMADYVRDVDVLLKKSMLVSKPGQLSSLAADIYMQTAAAKANLAMLPVADTDLSDTSKFLSQTGDYTAYIAQKVINDGELTPEEYEKLSALSQYAGKVNNQLAVLDNQLYEQQLSFSKVKNITVHAEEESQFIGSSMEELEKTFQDYPTLIYDGPFSEHIEHIQPVFLENKAMVSKVKALNVAKKFSGKDRNRDLTFSGEGNGKIKTYDFISHIDKKRELSVSVSKQGGYVVYMLDNRPVGNPVLSGEEAKEKAYAFLQENGFDYMKDSYYETDGKSITFNFAARQNHVILYADLIKVKVALDNGEVLGFESKGYLMNHQVRNLHGDLLSEEEIKAKINPHLIVESIRLAMIPLDSKREVLTYECKGQYNDEVFLLYINAQTGQEEKILMLTENENGMLTV